MTQPATAPSALPQRRTDGARPRPQRVDPRLVRRVGTGTGATLVLAAAAVAASGSAARMPRSTFVWKAGSDHVAESVPADAANRAPLNAATAFSCSGVRSVRAPGIRMAS